MYTVQWRDDTLNQWIDLTEHWFLWRARRVLLSRILQKKAVNEWRILKDDYPFLYVTWKHVGKVNMKKENALSWKTWKEQLIEVSGKDYGPDGPIGSCGEEAWRQYYDSGYSPEDAVAEDKSYWS